MLVFLLTIIASPLHAETDWGLWVANETSFWQPRDNSLFNPDQLLFHPPKTGNDLLANGRLSFKLADNRIRLQAAAAGRTSSVGETTHARLVAREAFAVFTLTENLDVSVGKKLVKWGTAAGYNPTGFADPLKDPSDPNDRLGLNQGSELAQVNYVRGDQSVDIIYFAPRLYFTSDPVRSRDRLAFRYNRLWRGLDFSAVGLLASGAANKVGANFSYVLGSSLELHGELAVARPRGEQPKERLLAGLGIPAGSAGGGVSWPRDRMAQSALGGSYTLRSGLTLTAEWHHDGEGLSHAENRHLYANLAADSLLAREALATGDPDAFVALDRLTRTAQNLPGIRQNKDTLFLMAGIMWGHEKYSLHTVALRQLQDRSMLVIPNFNAQLHRHWQLYLRPSFFLGRPKSEYGSAIYRSVLTVGLRYNL